MTEFSKTTRDPTRAEPEPKESEKFPGIWFWQNSWWFEDETNNFVGPYPNEEQANQFMDQYIKEL
jgi:hypothetical protein